MLSEVRQKQIMCATAAPFMNSTDVERCRCRRSNDSQVVLLVTALVTACYLICGVTRVWCYLGMMSLVLGVTCMVSLGYVVTGGWCHSHGVTHVWCHLDGHLIRGITGLMVCAFCVESLARRYL
jgi:hypothetical protein